MCTYITVSIVMKTTSINELGEVNEQENNGGHDGDASACAV